MAAAPAVVDPTKLDVFGDGLFVAGSWSHRPLGRPSVEGRRICAPTALTLAYGGTLPGRACGMVIVQNSRAVAVVTYDCRDGETGHVELRRGADPHSLIVHAQGVRGGLPFDDTSLFIPAGGCSAPPAMVVTTTTTTAPVQVKSSSPEAGTPK